MKINYDREVDILTVELDPSAAIDHAEHVDSVIVHFSPDDRPVLLEILDASDFPTRTSRSQKDSHHKDTKA